MKEAEHIYRTVLLDETHPRVVPDRQGFQRNEPRGEGEGVGGEGEGKGVQARSQLEFGLSTVVKQKLQGPPLRRSGTEVGYIRNRSSRRHLREEASRCERETQDLPSESFLSRRCSGRLNEIHL